MYVYVYVYVYALPSTAAYISGERHVWSAGTGHNSERVVAGFLNNTYNCEAKLILNISIIKPTRCTYFTDLFCHETLHVSDRSSSSIRSLFTVYSAMVYVIQVCRQLSSRIRMECSSIL